MTPTPVPRLRQRSGTAGLRVLSVFMALALFLFVRGERRVAESVTVPVRVLTPDGLSPAAPLPGQVTLALAGPWSRLRALSGSDLGPVIVDLSRSGPGVASWFIHPESIHVPGGVRVESIYPSQGTVELLVPSAPRASLLAPARSAP